METKDILTLPLAKRLEIMEALWQSLCIGDAGEYASPAWHESVLVDRARLLDRGLETIGLWSEAKARIGETTVRHQCARANLTRKRQVATRPP